MEKENKYHYFSPEGPEPQTTKRKKGCLRSVSVTEEEEVMVLREELPGKGG